MEPVIKKEWKDFRRKPKDMTLKANKEMHVWNWLSEESFLVSHFE